MNRDHGGLLYHTRMILPGIKMCVRHTIYDYFGIECFCKSKIRWSS